MKNKNLIALFFDLLEKVIGKTKTGNARMACIDFVCFLCLNPENKTKKKFKTIKHCFKNHKESFDGKIKFTRYQYTEFWLTHQIGDVYSMASRDGSVVECKVAYYPMPEYKDLRALIEIDLTKGTDFREVPIHYLLLKKKKPA